MRTERDRIIGVGGREVKLRGVNWFGFNNGDTAPSGLWTGDPMASDLLTVIARMRVLGFNCVRLPFSFKDFEKPGRDFSFDRGSVPSPKEILASCGKSDPSLLERATLPGSVKRNGTKCNDYLPTKTRDRFLFVVEAFATAGFYVLIDNHLREDTTALDDRKAWLQKYVDLVADLCKRPFVGDRLMIDILNEPGQYGLRWEDGGPKALGNLYLDAMDAIDKVAKPLYFVEGTGQDALGCNWGDGFCTDDHLIKANGLSDPRPFFDGVLNKPYRQRVVLSPHIYGPAVTHSEKASAGPALVQRLTNSFGVLTRSGYKGQRFPVCPGEFGSRFTEPRDLATMKTLALYIMNSGEARDGYHHSLNNWIFWCWNENSGDTGGLVQSDWRTLESVKLDYLSHIGLS